MTGRWRVTRGGRTVRQLGALGDAIGVVDELVASGVPLAEISVTVSGPDLLREQRLTGSACPHASAVDDQAPADAVAAIAIRGRDAAIAQLGEHGMRGQAISIVRVGERTLAAWDYAGACCEFHGLQAAAEAGRAGVGVLSQRALETRALRQARTS